MATHPLAGKPAPAELLIDPKRLEKQYYEDKPDPAVAEQRVAFGTSGHRGSAARRSFNEAHLLAISQAICEYRKGQGIGGPLFIGADTHLLSGPAQRTALEVLAANGIEVRRAPVDAFTPTPVISHAILTYNRGKNDASSRADGIVVTPSHNPPEDGGIKYNPPHGGPADTNATSWIEKRANELLGKLSEVKRVPYEQALKAGHVREYDYVTPYVEDLKNVVDLDVVRSANPKLGVDPLGGSNVAYWAPIAERYKLNIRVANPKVDPTFGFMTCDYDGKIRMDCSSPYAMANLVKMRNDYQLAFGNDADSDRHGIVTPSAGLMNPNHYLAVAISYLFGGNRPGWKPSAAIGKTLVSSGLIDRVANKLGRKLSEVPVGFKWFVDGLIDGSYGFGGEESAGASFLRRDGTVWTTDKDGIIMDLLAAEILSRTGKDPSEHYLALVAELGVPYYNRVDAPATPAQKSILKKLSPEQVKAQTLAGEPITAKLTRAPGNNAEIGGLKVVAKNGWFAARPSGTEDVYKIYAESFRDENHLRQILDEAQKMVSVAFGG